MSRVFRCNKCGTIFTQKTKYSIIKCVEPSTQETPAVPAQIIDLCTSCTTLFENFLHSNVTQERSGMNE